MLERETLVPFSQSRRNEYCVPAFPGFCKAARKAQLAPDFKVLSANENL